MIGGERVKVHVSKFLGDYGRKNTLAISNKHLDHVFCRISLSQKQHLILLTPSLHMYHSFLLDGMFKHNGSSSVIGHKHLMRNYSCHTVISIIDTFEKSVNYPLN